jgi:hypothetical protein
MPNGSRSAGGLAKYERELTKLRSAYDKIADRIADEEQES